MPDLKEYQNRLKKIKDKMDNLFLELNYLEDDLRAAENKRDEFLGTYRVPPAKLGEEIEILKGKIRWIEAELKGLEKAKNTIETKIAETESYEKEMGFTATGAAFGRMEEKLIPKKAAKIEKEMAKGRWSRFQESPGALFGGMKGKMKARVHKVSWRWGKLIVAFVGLGNFFLLANYLNAWQYLGDPTMYGVVGGLTFFVLIIDYFATQEKRAKTGKELAYAFGEPSEEAERIKREKKWKEAEAKYERAMREKKWKEAEKKYQEMKKAKEAEKGVDETGMEEYAEYYAKEMKKARKRR